MRYFISILLLLTVFNINAGEIFPTGCLPIVVKNELVHLSAKKVSLVMIHNLSTVDLWITHPVSDPNVSAGWSSHIQAGNWSALALSDKSFDLSCIESKPGHEQQVPCSGLLAVCQWPKATLPKNESGTFWAGEDMTLPALKAHVGSRGIRISTPNTQ